MTVSEFSSIMPIIITGAATLIVLLAGPFAPARATGTLAIAASVAAGVWAAFSSPTSFPTARRMRLGTNRIGFLLFGWSI